MSQISSLMSVVEYLHFIAEKFTHEIEIWLNIFGKKWKVDEIDIFYFLMLPNSKFPNSVTWRFQCPEKRDEDRQIMCLNRQDRNKFDDITGLRSTVLTKLDKDRHRRHSIKCRFWTESNLFNKKSTGLMFENFPS